MIIVFESNKIIGIRAANFSLKKEDIYYCNLPITVKDMKKVDKEKLEQLKKVKGVVLGGSEAQIIIGMGVQKLKDNITAILGLAE